MRNKEQNLSFLGSKQSLQEIIKKNQLPEVNTFVGYVSVMQSESSWENECVNMRKEPQNICFWGSRQTFQETIKNDLIA